MSEKIKTKGNKVVKYLDDRKVLRVVDNGNGFTVKSYSWTSMEPNRYFNLGYADAADLVDCLEKMDYR